MAKNKPAIPEATTTEELVRTRAYELYEQRGKLDGFDVEDWLTAEQEVRGSQVEKAAA